MIETGIQVIHRVDEVHRWSRRQHALGQTIGLVPTMGALHAGHISLVRAARAQCGRVIVSIFVNPTQFGPNEDFAKYPRTLEEDLALLEPEGVDAVFAPPVEEMYTPGASTFVQVAGLESKLDGRSRPGHFRGVATVVSKLFLMAQPDRAYFGQKDAAQVAVLRKMVHDLGFDLELVVCPIVREADGLALSSRNAYLSLEERRQALVLSRAVLQIKRLFAQGERDGQRLLQAARQELAAEAAVQIDYVELVDAATLEPIETAGKGSLFAVAAWVGKTRLIDNTVLGI